MKSFPPKWRPTLACGPEAAVMLTVSGVHTYYGRIQALHGVDVSVNKGEIVTLIGANGAGKSTLLMTICGNPTARRGRIMLDGTDITRMPTYGIMRRGLAHVPEGRRIFPRMTVLENLQMGATIGRPEHFAKDADKVFALFPILKERQSQRGGTLSGGEQQMLDRPRPDEPAAAAVARRAVAGLGAALRQADLRGHPQH